MTRKEARNQLQRLARELGANGLVVIAENRGGQPTLELRGTGRNDRGMSLTAGGATWDQAWRRIRQGIFEACRADPEGAERSARMVPELPRAAL